MREIAKRYTDALPRKLTRRDEIREALWSLARASYTNDAALNAYEAYRYLVSKGVKVPDEHEPGHATSAPAKPMIVRKFLITTVIATVLWGVAFYLIESDLISFRPS